MIVFTLVSCVWSENGLDKLECMHGDPVNPWLVDFGRVRRATILMT